MKSIVFRAAIVIFLVVCARPAFAESLAQRAPARVETPRRIDVNVLELASVRRLFHALARDRASLTDGERIAAWTDVSLIMTTVLGGPTVVGPNANSAGTTSVGPTSVRPLNVGPNFSSATIPAGFTFDEVAAAESGSRPLMVAATPGVTQRDANADKLLALGYSARETADVLSQRITQRALDTARRMIAVGEDRQRAANYLDSQYKAIAIFNTPRPKAGEVRRGPQQPGVFDALIDRYAALHSVGSDIVRAIIATESDFNPVARSHAGAIGLMQLMPGTARELGVNPFVPEQNIEGGVRYFSQLFKMFGTLELALVAYNAGPGFAARFAKRQTGLYGETREYVARVLTRLQDPPSRPIRTRPKTR